MARLIDGNLLIRDINADPYRTESEKSYDRCLVHRQPTVDAVEVVRCRECKHFGGHGICLCHAADVDGTPIFVREDDFCSYGERKNDEQK